MWKISHNIPINVKLNMYYAYIQSRIQFMLLIWGSASKSLLKVVQILQNKSLKSVFGLPYLYSTYDIYSNNRILPVNGLHQLKVCVYIKEILLGLRTSEVRLQFPEHSYLTRYVTNYNLCRLKLTSNHYGLSMKGPYIYNKVPLNIRSINSIKKFKQNVKKWLLEPENLSYFLS